MKDIKIGDTLTCTETGKQFIVEADGCSFNYAYDNDGNVFSDEGVDIREKRELLNRSGPFVCYVSSDGKLVTGWKGNKLGDIVRSSKGRTPRGVPLMHVRVRDVHGGLWHGKGEGEGIYITLRPSKSIR